MFKESDVLNKIESETEAKGDVNKIIEFPDRTITMSIGVAFNKDHEDLATLMHKADKALYESKENGKNQISYYDSRTLKR